MASCTQFYLTTVWKYKPKAVKRVIENFARTELADVEITYDSEYHWFKVICLAHRAPQVRKAFERITGEVEEDAFGGDGSSIMNPDGSIKTSFDNEWIGDGHEHPPPADPEQQYKSWGLPKMFAEFPHTAVWDDLDKQDEPFAIDGIATADQLAEMSKNSGVTISWDLSGRLAYIGGHDEKSLSEVLEKLKVLLAYRKMLSRRAQIEHVLYAEDYVEKKAADFKAETRYVANIDPKLAASTLFDRARARDLKESYMTLYREAVSIRHCYWDSFSGYWVSLLGPKVPGGSGKKYRLGNRPNISLKMASELLPSTGESILLMRNGETDMRVWTWISGTTGDVESIPSPAGDPSNEASLARPDPNPPAIGSPPRPSSSTAAANESLIDRLDEPIEGVSTTRSGDLRSSVTGPVDKAAETDEIVRQIASLILRQFPELSENQPNSSRTGAESTPETESAESRDDAESSEGSINELPSKGASSVSLIDLQSPGDPGSSKGVSNPPISWDMPALVPQSVSTARSRDAHSPGKRSKSGNNNLQPMKNQAVQKQAGKLAASLPKASNPRLREAGRLPATEKFIEEIEAAMAKLLVTGPYRRGKVELRAELGRVLLSGLDVSALAFNDVSTPSNGWEKAELLKKLGIYFGQPKDIHFTKILTTYSSDIEDMINIKSGEARLWKENPSHAWTVYSFRCALRSKDRPIQFVVDIEDDPTAHDPFSYSIRLLENVGAAQGLLPIYVHAIRRNWDLGIRMSYVNTERAEKAFGCVAISLLQSLSVSHIGKRGPELKFAIPKGQGWEIDHVRKLTKWRHASLKDKSQLEITEVEQMEISPLPDGIDGASKSEWDVMCAQPWTQRTTQQKRVEGEFPRWYEAAVVSTEAEAVFRENQTVEVGEKADWTYDKLKERGIPAAIYGPALQLLREMDHVGRNDDNGLSAAYGHLLIKGNKPSRTVPALSLNKSGTVPGMSPAQGSSRRRGGRA